MQTIPSVIYVLGHALINLSEMRQLMTQKSKEYHYLKCSNSECDHMEEHVKEKKKASK